MKLFRKLSAALEYLEPQQISKIEEAYSFAAQAHTGQKRQTGEDYITHPVEVALILANMRMDTQTVMAALLHDVIEDTPTDKPTLAKKFGRQVAELVDSVSKLTQIEFRSRKEAQAENFRKMLLAMSKDVRVILIKLADRMHNVRTLEPLPSAKRWRIARETLDIYAPIAKRLGMREVSTELEELSFKCLYPYRYQTLRSAVSRVQGSRIPILREIDHAFNKKLDKAGISDYKIEGREKHLYSIYKKMRDKNIPFSEITDVYAIRIIVTDIEFCYRALGLVHSLYKPVPESFKDYIALPKYNGYQSLHTVLFGPYGVPIEVQIRTFEMHDLANSGIAAHWLYKSGAKINNKSQIIAQQWMKDLLDIQRATGNSLEFIENVKIDLFPDEVYVFTPKGGILELPKGATPIDFAYAVHTDVGNTCLQAKIDRQIKPLSTQLSSGQTIEIITSPNAQPHPEWLELATTGKALSNIRHYFKRRQRKESIELGRQLLDLALNSLNLSLEDIPENIMQIVLKEVQVSSLDDLFAAIGLGDRIAVLTANRLLRAMKKESSSTFQSLEPTTAQPLFIRGTEGIVVRFSTCCHPIPGDPILGILKAGEGIAVHLEQCQQIVRLHRLSDKCVSVRWAKDLEGEFSVPVRAEVIDQRGLLALLSKVIADKGAGIDDLSVISRDGRSWILDLQLLVKSRDHLKSILHAAHKLHFVMNISRIVSE